MVLELLAHARKVDQDRDLSLLEKIGITNATELEDLWGVDCPRGDDDLLLCLNPYRFVAARSGCELDPNGNSILEEDLGNLVARDQLVIGPCYVVKVADASIRSVERCRVDGRWDPEQAVCASCPVFGTLYPGEFGNDVEYRDCNLLVPFHNSASLHLLRAGSWLGENEA